MPISEVLVAERRTLRVPFPASTANAVGDLLWWDDSANLAKKASTRTDTGSVAGNQADFSPLFLGVAADQRLAAETAVTGAYPTGPGDRLVVTEGIFDAPCASAAFEFGDLVGVSRDGTPLNTDQVLVGVAQPALALGFVVKREPVAVTKVRCFLSSFLFGFFRQRGAAGPLGVLPGAGVGGAVTQATNASTGVTLSKLAGQITTVALTTAAAAEEAFVVTNTLVAATDVIAVSTTYAGAGTPIVAVKGVAAGGFTVVITNVHASAALDAVLVVNFVVLKGAAS